LAAYGIDIINFLDDRSNRNPVLQQRKPQEDKNVTAGDSKNVSKVFRTDFFCKSVSSTALPLFGDLCPV